MLFGLPPVRDEEQSRRRALAPAETDGLPKRRTKPSLNSHETVSVGPLFQSSR